MSSNKEYAYKISTNELESAVRSIVTTEDLSQLTAGRVRKYLADYFNTTKEYMDSRESEVNNIINGLLTEMASKKVKVKNSDSQTTLFDFNVKQETKPSPENNGLVAQLREEIANDALLLRTLDETHPKRETQVKPETRVKQERQVSIENPAEVSEEPPRKVSRLQQDLMTKDFFLTNARSLEIKLGDSDPIFAKPRAFSTGNLGWFINSKIKCQVGDQEVVCQVGVTCTGWLHRQTNFGSAIGSKNWKD